MDTLQSYRHGHGQQQYSGRLWHVNNAQLLLMGPQESIRHTISLILTKTETFLWVFFVVVVLMLLMKHSDLTTRMLQKTLSSGQPVFFQTSIVQLDTQCGILLPYPFCLQGSTRLCIQSCSSAYPGCNKCLFELLLPSWISLAILF